MAFAPSASWNSRSITHLANYLSRSLPMNSSDQPKFQTGWVHYRARPFSKRSLLLARPTPLRCPFERWAGKVIGTIKEDAGLSSESGIPNNSGVEIRGNADGNRDRNERSARGLPCEKPAVSGGIPSPPAGREDGVS